MDRLVAARVGVDGAGPALDWSLQELPTAGPPAPAPAPPNGDVVLTAGSRIGDFRVRRLLGEGATGQVYLAQDLTLGRRVALKLLKGSAMEGDTLARFLEEARATARFNHPHIVTLHAVGEHHGRPYLALEYLDGESLRARLAAGPLPLRDALGYCRAVAEAVAEAHRRGLVHADLKPENVVIPRDGRLRVVDFGLARLASSGAGGTEDAVSGTPAYMAPERWRGEAPTGAIDVWSLGVLLHELVTGRRPVPDAALEELAFRRAPIELPPPPDPPWMTLVRACLALTPAGRPSAEEVVRRLGEMLAPPRTARAGTDTRSPFPGLGVLSREHAALTGTGRRARLDALGEQLRTRSLVCVVGPAGSGKSSFVRAGLLPRIEVAGGWIVRALQPGARPFDALAAALAPPAGGGSGPVATADALHRDPGALARTLDDTARRHSARVLLFIDQLEELFARATAAEARAFCECLGRAATPTSPWRIVIALRDSALDALAAIPELRPHLGSVTRLPSPSAAELRAAVAVPLANAGYEPDSPELIARIAADVEGQPGGLPLLQLACQALWERRDARTRRVLASEYEVMGGAAGALATHARRVEAELSPDEAAALRLLVLALFRADGTRRAGGRREVLEQVPAASREIAGRVLDRLLERRVVVETSPVGALEFAHRGLDAAWPQLARWLDATHAGRRALDALEEAAIAWRRGGRRRRDTLSGPVLTDLAPKLEEGRLAPSPLARAFLAESVRSVRQARKRERERLGRWGTAAVLVAVAVAAAITALIFTLALAR